MSCPTGSRKSTGRLIKTLFAGLILLTLASCAGTAEIIVVKPGQPVILLEETDEIRLLAPNSEGVWKEGVGKIPAGYSAWHEHREPHGQED